MALYLFAHACACYVILSTMCDGCENDTPLKQVVELCSLLGLQTLTGEEKEPLMCMFVGRKEGSFWRRRQISFRKNLGNPDKLKTTVLWISPAPNPDSGLFGNREESEEESSSAESESKDWEKREGRDANEDVIDASSGDPVEPEGDNWTLVTSRGWGSERLSSPSSIGWSKHIIRVRSNFFNPRNTSSHLLTSKAQCTNTTLGKSSKLKDFMRCVNCENSCNENFQNYIPTEPNNSYIIK